MIFKGDSANNIGERSLFMEKKIPPKAKEVIKAFKSTGKKTDTQGCYTGNPDDFEVPVQDQDDL